MNKPPSTQTSWLYKIVFILIIICFALTVLLFSMGRAPDAGIPFVLLLLLLSLYVKSTVQTQGQFVYLCGVCVSCRRNVFPHGFY